MGFAHAAGFAAAWQCLRFLVSSCIENASYHIVLNLCKNIQTVEENRDLPLTVLMFLTGFT